MKILFVIGVTAFLVACSTASKTNMNNILLENWQGNYGGVPAFDKVKVSDFAPALTQAMELKRQEVAKIANNNQKANFENTIASLEKAGEVLGRISSVFGVWSSNMQSSDFQKIETEMAPKLAAFSDEIYQNAELFKRIEAVRNSKEKLTTEQKRLVDLYYDRFVFQGAMLSPEQKKKVSDINQKMAALETQFSQNLLADEDSLSIDLDTKSELDGMPEDFIEAAKEDAIKHGMKGKFRIANTRSSIEPLLNYANKRELRERAFRLWTARGDGANQNNNNKIVTEILSLRLERSKIMGHKSYAHWSLASETMAKTPEAAMALMLKVWWPAVAQVQLDLKEMQAIANSEGEKFKIEAWDYRFYAEKLRKAKYDLDLGLLKPYLQLEKIQQAMFWAAEKLYGIKFIPVKGVPVFHADVRVFEVLDAKGKLVGLWYFDPYARTGKRSGAWMSEYRTQENFDGKFVYPIVSNNSNFIQGKPGEAVLISWDDAITMFHEFGHAIHGLLSHVHYPSLAGTNVFRDFVEFPSQVNEKFLSTPEVLKFLTDAKGNPIPKDLIEKVKKAERFNQGFSMVEFLASGIVDMKLHLETSDVNPVEFEKRILGELKMPREIVMRHRIPQFGHIFSGHEYSAGYYSYLWAQVIDNDAFAAFSETGDYYSPAVAKKMKDYILSVGNSIDPAEAYRKFRGRDAKIDALLKRLGFPKVVSP